MSLLDNMRGSLQLLKSFFDNYKFVKIFLLVSTLLSITSIASIAFSFLFTYKPDAFTSTTTASPTANTYTSVKIGAKCSYNYECPEKAFCYGTCMCPDTYYFNSINGKCVLRKSESSPCNNDYECNLNVGLKCISTTCQCNTKYQFWNSTFYTLLGFPTGGRCQNKKVFGMQCTNSGDTISGMNCWSNFGSSVSRAFCCCSNYYSLENANCDAFKRNNDLCTHPSEATYGSNNLCYKSPTDNVRRTFPVPTMAWTSSYYYTKNTGFNTGCSATYKCNDWAELICINNVCSCYDKYYYHNGTKCNYGKRLGEKCSTNSECVPTSAGMQCSSPFTGSTINVCRCTTSQYFDYTTEKCESIKYYSDICRDSSECYSTSTYSMYCGMQSGSGFSRCLCPDGFYNWGTTCIAKRPFGGLCSSVRQCLEHLNQTCDTAAGSCDCSSDMYYNSIDLSCNYKKYDGETCSANSECWSASCSSSKCI
jgi:hypothetical protein